MSSARSCRRPSALDISRAHVAAVWGDNLLVDFGDRYGSSTDGGATWQQTNAGGAELSSVDAGKAVFTYLDWVEVLDLATNQLTGFH